MRTLLVMMMLAVFPVAGCDGESSAPPNRFAEVKLGMTAAEVEEILGAPTAKASEPAIGVVARTYRTGDDVLVFLFFEHGKVTRAIEGRGAGSEGE